MKRLLCMVCAWLGAYVGLPLLTSSVKNHALTVSGIAFSYQFLGACVVAIMVMGLGKD